MSKLYKAILLDAMDKPLEASQAYEEVLGTEHLSLDTMLNAAVLYFVCLDGGYAAAHHLPETFLTTAWERAFELLNQADSLYHQPPEVEFWRLYFLFILLGDDPAYDICEQMVNGKGLLIPVFHLLSSPRGTVYVDAARKLLDQVREGKTAKQRYIQSVTESGLMLLNP